MILCVPLRRSHIKKVPFSIRLEVDKIEKIDQLAALYKISRNEFISQCIDYALENFTPPQEKTPEDHNPA